MIYPLVLVLIFLSPQITTTQNTTEDSKTESSSNESSKLKENDQAKTQQVSSLCSIKESQINPARCPSEHECSKLDASCMTCNCTSDCKYGGVAKALCTVPESISCTGERSFEKSFICQYCYQSNGSNHECSENFECNSVADPNSRLYRAECSVPQNLICLGNRNFLKLRPCNWTGGYKWTTALALSITLGGFGADRFYLGHWQEGIGKLFSFGGLGVWTLVDVVMVAIRYIGPADGSLYI